ncbi:MAG TPA: DUF1638 domain-containing protein [Actinomycetes bacterium]|nr:DUF1638 domain-containing protein [Actinomycetes bacterium]
MADRIVATDRVAIVACGALAQDLNRVARDHGWPVDVHPLPPLLHNRPDRIAREVARLVPVLRRTYRAVAVGYADCGTYGELDEICHRLRLRRLGGQHCYDVLAGQARMRELLEREPGTYLLTDFLVRSFARTVVVELGLDRYPELRADYFRHYRRVVWLTQRPTAELVEKAEAAAGLLELPLDVIHVGDAGLAGELRALLGELAG